MKTFTRYIVLAALALLLVAAGCRAKSASESAAPADEYPAGGAGVVCLEICGPGGLVNSLGQLERKHGHARRPAHQQMIVVNPPDRE